MRTSYAYVSDTSLYLMPKIRPVRWCQVINECTYATYRDSPLSARDWLNGNGVGNINEVNIITLRRSRLVLRWVIVRGYNHLGYVTSHSG